MSSVLRSPTRRLLGVLLLVFLFLPLAVQIAEARGSKAHNPTYVEEHDRGQDGLPEGNDGGGVDPGAEPEGDPDDFGLWIPEILVFLLTQVYSVIGR